MKLTKLLSALIFVLLFLPGCNKDTEPIILTGLWQLDTNATFLQVVYNSSAAQTYPDALQYLNNHKRAILKEIKKPNMIQFTAPNTVDFIYNNPIGPSISGTYTQYDIYVSIKNSLFPTGITGASNNEKLEIYYSKEYMMGILKTMLTAEDDSPEVFENLIVSFDGVGVYTRPNNLQALF